MSSGSMIVARSPVHLVSVGGERRAVIGDAVLRADELAAVVEWDNAVTGDYLEVSDGSARGVIELGNDQYAAPQLNLDLRKVIVDAVPADEWRTTTLGTWWAVVPSALIVNALFDAFGLTAYEPRTPTIAEVA